MRPKIVHIVVSGLSYGGTETFVIKLVNYLVHNSKVSVKLYVLSYDLTRSSQLDTSVLLNICGNKFSKLLCMLKLFFKSNVHVFGVDFWPYFFLAPSVLLYERTDFRHYGGLSLFSRPIIKLIRKRFGDKLIYQTASFVELHKSIINSKSKPRVLKNFYAGLNVGRTIQIGEIDTVLWVGRLSSEKNPFFLVSLEFVQFVKNKKLIIYGDGPLRNDLLAQLEENEVNYEYMGLCDNPFARGWTNAVLVLPSLFEGVPNVLLEALDASMPVFINPNLVGAHDYIDSEKSSIDVLMSAYKIDDYIIKNVKTNVEEIKELFRLQA